MSKLCPHCEAVRQTAIENGSLGWMPCTTCITIYQPLGEAERESVAKEHAHAMWGQQCVIDELARQVDELRAELNRRDRIEEERELMERSRATTRPLRTFE